MKTFTIEQIKIYLEWLKFSSETSSECLKYNRIINIILDGIDNKEDGIDAVLGRTEKKYEKILS